MASRLPPALVIPIAAASLATATACASVPAAGDPPPLEGTAWIIHSLADRAMPIGGTATLRFENGRAAGSDGCNRFMAPYSATGAAVVIGPVNASTLRGCNPEVMRRAQAVLQAMNDARRYRIEDDRLQLLSAKGATLAVYTRQPASLPGTSWRVTSYNNGRQAVVSVRHGTTLTMEFGADGRVAGSAGCNSFGAAYTADGAAVHIGPPISTKMMCAVPEGVMDQEQQFLAALATAATARFEGTRLELRTAEGALAVSAELEGRR